MEPLNVRPQANVTITFATEQQNGVLLYTGDKQHLVIDLDLDSSHLGAKLKYKKYSNMPFH